MSISEPIKVFYEGVTSAVHYRIPSIIRTKSGVLVAACDARYCGYLDNPNRIDKVVRRSLDDGVTWGDTIYAARGVGEEKFRSSSCIDAQMTYDEDNNIITMLYVNTSAGIGIFNAQLTKGVDDSGNYILRKRLGKYRLIDGKICTMSASETGYVVDANGNITNTSKGKNCGNIYTKGKFRLSPTFYLMAIHSHDEGLTWSSPVCLNKDIKTDSMGFLCAGPGQGLVVKYGANKGRYIAPVYFGTRVLPFRMSNAIIYSDDLGKSWKMGGIPNNQRKVDGKDLNIMKVKNDDMITESQLIELEDGTLRWYMRNHHSSRTIAIADSHDGGMNWVDFRYDEQLPQPICQASVLKLRGLDKPYVVFCNPASKTERKCGTMRLSEDNGLTFPYSKVIREGEFVYSCMADLGGGKIAVLYEPNNITQHIDFITISIDDIKGNN